MFLTRKEQSLAGWQLKRQVGGDAAIIYKFPPKYTLKAGATVTVRYTHTKKFPPKFTFIDRYKTM